MDILIENLLFVALALGSALVFVVFLYSKIKTPKSIFSQPTNHIEIHSWRLK